MKVLLSIFIAAAFGLLLLSADQGPYFKPGAKAYVRVEAQNLRHTVKIHSSYLSLLTFQQLFTKECEISSDSSVLLEFENDIPARYSLSVDKELSIPIFLIPGDTLLVELDFRANGSTPKVRYEGLTSDISQYLYDKPEDIAFSKDAANLFNSPLHQGTAEKSLVFYRHKSDSVAAVQRAYVQAQADAYKLPSWFVELEEIESQLFARYHQLVIVDYWNTFYDVGIEAPAGYYNSIEPIDIANPTALSSFYYYLYLPVMLTRTPDFLHYKSQFLDSCGVKTVDDLKGTNAYSTFYLKQANYVIEKADELVSDESFHPILTNLFFHTIKVLDRTDRAKLFDRVKSKLSDSDLLPFVVGKYEEMSLHLAPGIAAPDFYLLSDDDNKYLTLQDFKGKVLLLNFWFPGCKPCIYEIPHEKQLMENYGDKGFAVINICMQATIKQWETALTKFSLQGVNVLTQGNWERKLKEAYGIDGFPHYVLVDQEGKVVENLTHRPSDPRLARLIEATLHQ